VHNCFQQELDSPLEQEYLALLHGEPAMPKDPSFLLSTVLQEQGFLITITSSQPRGEELACCGRDTAAQGA